MSEASTRQIDPSTLLHAQEAVTVSDPHPPRGEVVDASEFPVDVDVGSGTFFFRKVSRQSLSEPAFLDGRTQFWTGEGSSRPVQAVDPVADTAAFRLILHVGFCGSTLLASVLDQPGRALVLREPHVLAALAEQAGDLQAVAPQLWKACNLLSRQFAPGEAIVIKPTNWFNNLAPLIARAPQVVRPVFISASQAEYLTAAFRGGRERIAFVMKLAAHLVSKVPGGPALWQSAAAAQLDPLERAARIVLLVRSLQHRLFRRALLEGGWKQDRWIEFSDLTDDLPATAWRASRLLALDLDRDELEQRCRLAGERNVKSSGGAFSREGRQAQDRDVRSLYQSRFEAAQHWAAATLADEEPRGSYE